MNNLSLLLVEDNPDDEWLALRTLRKLGLEQVTVVRDGFAAVSVLIRQVPALRPDLVLLDMKLPLMDGIEVLHKVREQAATSSLNVVLLTSSEDPHALETCRNLGVLACLQKPLTAVALLPILQSLPVQGPQHPAEERLPSRAAVPAAGWTSPNPILPPAV
ncbi:response regulator [Geomonas azotofigens]|uniref:response regulator n=1 Tax=Geomonas azotofigens TaxID=2843196 RepID=UPI001C106010|nr:response regulator [Geomonas azotofigens]MBU5612843.1 response regulator [Geomonas azotofigens]